MARPRKPYEQLAFQRPNSRHKGRQTVVLPASPRCGFCGRWQGEVDQLIQGSAGGRYSYICNECVGDAVELLATLDADSTTAGGSEPSTG